MSKSTKTKATEVVEEAKTPDTADLVEATAEELAGDALTVGIPPEDTSVVLEGIGVEDIQGIDEEAKVEPTPEPEAIKEMLVEGAEDLPAPEGIIFEKYADGKTKEEADADYKQQEVDIQELLIKAKLSQRK